eukprot:TRINITY_DN7030_c0_g1_i1.p1 TRINITY_DN7030_c0_g1~~TRINITY_DN7030_c0_g1_i1.p1  ORF type:complete len:279 (-),score=43.04 TRINITY_DN7030_c0_g1_i1:197-1033(-)
MYHAANEVIEIKPHEMVISEENSRKLFRWNLALGLLHLATSAVIFGITNQNAVAPVYFFWADSATRGRQDWLPSPQKLFNSKIGYLSGVFLLLAGLDHFLVATVFRESYEGYLVQKRNPFRWIEYSLSASFMHVEIAQLAGIFDIHLLACIFGLTMTTMLFGNEQEVATQHLWNQVEKKSLRPFWIGFVPHVFCWAIICHHFFHGVAYADPPAFVWAIIFILLVLDSTFAVNMWLQQKEIGKWSDYIFGEVIFCVLSLSAKQLLAWLNFGGTEALVPK